MQAKSLRRALEKVGVVITKTVDGGFAASKVGSEYIHALEWYEDTDGYVSCLRTPSSFTDAMTDCFCDTYYSTIKSAMYFLTR